MRRDGDKATVACNFTTQTWHIVCQHDSWFGSIDNCTVGTYCILYSCIHPLQVTTITVACSLKLQTVLHNDWPGKVNGVRLSTWPQRSFI